MNSMDQPWLISAAVMSTMAALLHLACIVGGPDWYRILGAGEDMARLAQAGSWVPPLVTLGIAGVLAAWAMFALSAAGLIPPIPFTRMALVAIIVVLFLRAGAYFIRDVWRPDLSHSFMLWSSLIVLVMGIAFAVGTWKAWPMLSRQTA